MLCNHNPHSNQTQNIDCDKVTAQNKGLWSTSMSVHSGVDAAEDVLTSDFSSRLPLSGRSPSEAGDVPIIEAQHKPTLPRLTLIMASEIRQSKVSIKKVDSMGNIIIKLSKSLRIALAFPRLLTNHLFTVVLAKTMHSGPENRRSDRATVNTSTLFAKLRPNSAIAYNTDESNEAARAPKQSKRNPAMGVKTDEAVKAAIQRKDIAIKNESQSSSLNWKIISYSSNLCPSPFQSREHRC
eukprot:m.108759 g.108759  ORF g.108759 m.108759 type:complete len:239 (+) comp13977_c0_seq1:45-761(+)